MDDGFLTFGRVITILLLVAWVLFMAALLTLPGVSLSGGLAIAGVAVVGPAFIMALTTA